MDKRTFNLSNGMEVPALCYGPGMILNNVADFNIIKKVNSFKTAKQVYSDMKKQHTIHTAVKNESELFLDTATAYGYAEGVIGKIITKCDRKKITLCTKISARDQIRHGKKIKNVFSNSLQRLGTDYIDVYLMHWPVTSNYIDVWKQMEELYLQGKIGAIGVCNCHIHHLEDILTHGSIKPLIHQMEVHPLFTQNVEREFCNSQGIRIMAYTPIARNDDRLTNSRLLNHIAKKYRKTISQIILRWHIQLGHIPVVATKNISHYWENKNIFDFQLSEDEVELITKLNINARLRYDSDNCDFLEL